MLELLADQGDKTVGVAAEAHRLGGHPNSPAGAGGDEAAPCEACREHDRQGIGAYGSDLLTSATFSGRQPRLHPDQEDRFALAPVGNQPDSDVAATTPEDRHDQRDDVPLRQTAEVGRLLPNGEVDFSQDADHRPMPLEFERRSRGTYVVPSPPT